MSIFNDKALKSVAEAAAKIMGEELKGNQHKIDANKNGKIDAHDFKLLRGKKDVKEEVEQIDEAIPKSTHYATLHSSSRKIVAKGNKKEMLKKIKELNNKEKGSHHLGMTHRGKVGDTFGEEVEITEGFDDHKKIAAELIKRHGKNVNKQHIKDLEDERDSRRPLDHSEVMKHVKQMQKESVQLDEAFPTVADAKKRMDAGKTATGSVTKTATGLIHKRDYKDDDGDDTSKKKGYGAHQNKGARGKSEGTKKVQDDDKLKDTGKRYDRPGKVTKTKTGLIHKMTENISFTEMLELYNEHGLKVLAPIETEEMDIDGTTIEVIDADKVNGFIETTIEEEVTNDEFTKEYEDQKASFEGKKKQPKVAAGKTTGVKEMPESVEQIDERELTKGEASKKEDYVKGMKKKLSGFKERYGDRAKSVMYATATKMAKKD